MLTQDEQFQIMMNVLQRLKPEFSTPRQEEIQSYWEHSASGQDIYPEAAAPHQGAPRLPRLSKQINALGLMPAGSTILGLCEDGLPLLFDLKDSGPGSLLIAADPDRGKSRLLESILAATCVLNSPEIFSFYLVTPNPAELVSLINLPHCLEVISPYETAIEGLVMDFVSVAEQRGRSAEDEPLLVFAIDDLAALLRTLSSEARRYLRWLIKHGPLVGVWIFATLDASQARTLDKADLKVFGSRLIGEIISPSLASYLSGYSAPLVQSLVGGSQFCVLFGNEWIRFWILDPTA